MKIFSTKNKKDISPTKWKIKKQRLGLIFEAAKSTYRNEFRGFLRVDENKKNTIHEIVILPRTISGDSHNIFKLHMMPIDLNIVGNKINIEPL